MGGERQSQTSSPRKKTARTTGESNENEKSIPNSKSDSKPQSRRDSIKSGATSNKTREQYYNPDPLARLIGKSNESTIIIDGNQCTALIDSGAQVTTITIDLVNKLKLPIYGLQTLLNFRGTGGGNIPYHGYTGVTMEIPEIKGFKEDVLMMVIDDDDYGKRVPIQLGTLHIDQIISQATPNEITSLNKAWDRARICSYIGGRAVKVQECKDFTLDHVKGSLTLTKYITLQPFESVRVRGITKVRNHQKRVHVIVEPREVQCKTVSAISTYSHLKPGSSKISIALRNFSCRKIAVKAKSTVATISAANIVPGKIAPKESGGDILEGDREGKLPPKLTQEQVNNLLTKLEFKGPESVGWTETDQQEALKFLTDYGVVFAKDDMDLGKTSLVRHQINLTDYRPFKERYRRIPPHQYEEVRKHLQEMLDIGAIRKSQSPWASAVVLV